MGANGGNPANPSWTREREQTGFHWVKIQQSSTVEEYRETAARAWDVVMALQNPVIENMCRLGSATVPVCHWSGKCVSSQPKPSYICLRSQSFAVLCYIAANPACICQKRASLRSSHQGLSRHIYSASTSPLSLFQELYGIGSSPLYEV